MIKINLNDSLTKKIKPTFLFNTFKPILIMIGILFLISMITLIIVSAQIQNIKLQSNLHISIILIKSVAILVCIIFYNIFKIHNRIERVMASHEKSSSYLHGLTISNMYKNIIETDKRCINCKYWESIYIEPNNKMPYGICYRLSMGNNVILENTVNKYLKCNERDKIITSFINNTNISSNHSTCMVTGDNFGCNHFMVSVVNEDTLEFDKIPLKSLIRSDIFKEKRRYIIYNIGDKYNWISSNIKYHATITDDAFNFLFDTDNEIDKGQLDHIVKKHDSNIIIFDMIGMKDIFIDGMFTTNKSSIKLVNKLKNMGFFNIFILLPNSNMLDIDTDLLQKDDIIINADYLVDEE